MFATGWVPTTNPENALTPAPKGYDFFDKENEKNIKTSPDGQWLWSDNILNQEGDHLYHEIHIVSTDGKYEWRIKPDPQDIHNKYAYDVWYDPFFWLSGKQPYLFLVGRMCCADGPGIPHNMLGLVRLDLLSGKISIQVPFTIKDYLFSFSPTGKYLLMEQVGKYPIQISRLIDDKVNTINLSNPFEQALEAKWSPDGKHVALWICSASEGYNPCGSIETVIIAEPEMPTFQTVVPDINSALNLSSDAIDTCDFKWDSNTQLSISCIGKKMEYDISTGKTTKNE
jgi:hypothetical protein